MSPTICQGKPIGDPGPTCLMYFMTPPYLVLVGVFGVTEEGWDVGWEEVEVGLFAMGLVVAELLVGEAEFVGLGLVETGDDVVVLVELHPISVTEHTNKIARGMSNFFIPELLLRLFVANHGSLCLVSFQMYFSPIT